MKSVLCLHPAIGDIVNFSEFGFDSRIAAAVSACGYQTPTPIQRETIPAAMKGRDVMGLAQTGTGKTAAFALPIMEQLLDGPRGTLRAVVLAPTRELAEQICASFRELGHGTRLKVTTVYGGVHIGPQIQVLRRGVDIVVACPGRLLDHINQRTIDLSHVSVSVLDEADMMLDMGFLPDVRRILAKLPPKRQNMMFSATMPEAIRTLSAEILHQPVVARINHSRPVDTVAHALYPVSQQHKTALLLALLKQTDSESVLIFTRTKHRAKKLGTQLGHEGHRATSLQGNLSQSKRQAALEGFRRGQYDILVATDIAARGLDITQVTHVINYDLPATVDAYTHRIGRTGRASRSGDAFSFVTREDESVVRDIERVLGSRIERKTLAGFDYKKPVEPVSKPAAGASRQAPHRSKAAPRETKPQAWRPAPAKPEEAAGRPGRRNRRRGPEQAQQERRSRRGNGNRRRAGDVRRREDTRSGARREHKPSAPGVNRSHQDSRSSRRDMRRPFARNRGSHSGNQHNKRKEQTQNDPSMQPRWASLWREED